MPFDLDRLEVTGAAVPILGDVSMNTIAWRGVAQFSISRSGALAYIAGSASVPERSLVWVDRQGRVEPVTEERRGFLSPRLSTSGDQLAVSVQDGVDADVWVYDLRRGTKTRLTFGKNNYGAVWTRDGRNVVFSSNRDGGFRPVHATGGRQRQRATTHLRRGAAADERLARWPVPCLHPARRRHEPRHLGSPARGRSRAAARPPDALR